MSPAEFITEAVDFPLGAVVVLSGADISSVEGLLGAAKTAIEASTAKSVLLFNSRDTVPYPERHFVPEDAQDAPGPFPEDAARLREFDVVAASGQFVILVANQFDIDDASQNRRPVSVIIDTVLDLFRPRNVDKIPFVRHRGFAEIRELYAYVTKVYHYDTRTDEVTFVKNHVPHRP